MEKFKKCPKKRFRGTRRAKFLIKKQAGISEESKSTVFPSNYITSIIVKYLNDNKSKVNKHDYDMYEKESQDLKDKLFFNKSEILEIDIIKSCLYFDNDETLQQINYKILYDVLKKCIDHENILMKVEELGFSAENIKSQNDEDVHICSKYQSKNFLNYIYQNLKAVTKINKNFDVLYKLMKIIKSIMHIIPYKYKIKYLFYFCSLFNIYQKEYERTSSPYDNEDIDENSKEGNKNDSTIFTNIDQENFLNVLFELITGLINLKLNYNNYDDNYLIFNYFVLRWILVFFKNKYTFFSKKKIHSLIKAKYMILLFSILKNLHESCNFNVDSVLSNTQNDTKILLNNNGTNVNGENAHGIDQQYLYDASGNYIGNFIGEQNINNEEFVNQMGEREYENFNYESTINFNEPTVLDFLCNEKGNKDGIVIGSSIYEKIKNTKDEINNIIKTFYDKVDLNIEKNMKEIKDNINVSTHDIFITFYNLFSKINDIHKHIVLLYFSQDFIKISEYEYSYYIIFNSFQLLNKLLTIENFVIHPLIFLSLEQVMAYYENVIIYLYKKKNDMNEEFYKFCENFNTKHKNIYENIFTRMWSLYMLIISDEYTKKDDDDKLNEKSSAFINLNASKDNNLGINANQKEMHITNYINNYISILKINDLHFSNEYKDLILSNTNKGYINCLVSCLSTSYRVIGLGFYFEENYFFTYNELIYRDIFILNRMLKDSNKLYYGGNFKFLMNFFYPLLMCYINLYEKEPNHSIKKELFLSYIKNVLIHFSRTLNDCINLYYFISTQIEDIYILATKFTNCNDYTLLLLFINFLTNFYTSTIKSNQKQKHVEGQNILLNMKNVSKHISNVKYKYTNINLQKNNYFLNHISDNLLKIFIPRFITFLTSTYQQKFTPSNNLVAQENTQSVLDSFSSLIYLCLHFSSSFNFNDILVVLEQILQNGIEKDIFSLISILNVIKIVIPFFTFDQLKICSIYYKKAMCAINDILSNKLYGFTVLENDGHNLGNVDNNASIQVFPQTNNSNSVNYFDNTFCSEINQNEFQNGLHNSSSLNGYNAEDENSTSNSNSIYPNIQSNSSMLYRENNLSFLTQGQIGKNDKINNERITTKSKGNKVKNGIKKAERKTKTKRDKKIKNLKKKKITKDMKLKIEKFKFAKFLIFEGVSELFRYFGNIILSKRKEQEELMQNRDQNNTRENWNDGNAINENNTGSMINNNEMNIFNSIFVGQILHEDNLPEMLKKENILIFFDNISNYNTNKYIKKIYTYINNLTMYLKECKEIDSSYSYDIFFSILPIIMKWLFFINKTFTGKTSRKALFENIIHIGKANIKNLFLHITPGLLVEDINCKKIAVHILYLLIKNCRIEYEDQKQLFNLCLTCAYDSDKSLLKVLLKFLLSSIFTFSKDIIMSNIKNLTNLLNLISNKKTYIYTIQKFFSKLNNMLEKEIKNNEFENINSPKIGLENIEINSPLNDNGIDNSNEPPLMPYLTKKSKQIFRKFIKMEKMNNISNAFENKNEFNHNRMNSKHKIGKSIHKNHKNSQFSSEHNLNSNIMLTKYDGHSDSVDSYRSNEYDSDMNNYDDVESVGSFKNRDINKRKNKSHKITKNRKNKNIANAFFENVSKHIGEKEKTFMQTTLTQIMAKPNKTHKNVKGKIPKLKSNPLISDILINLGNFITKNKTNLNVSLKNKKEIKNLFGDKYFIKQNTNNENKNTKNYDSSSEDDEGQIEIRNDGKIVIHNLDSNSKNTKNKKRKDEMLLKKYNIINEKQNMHSKSKTMNKSINKRNKNQFITADKNAYKSKKGQGDIIKKNKPLPYSYVALKPIMAKEKFRSKTLHAFKSIKNSSKKNGKKRKLT
ncbi:conserved Plasmodium protein, unknown function [Plasmodium vinckei]|uniref:Uncharacterized protein n=1 Tax=Plasmodium vinckei TaxID=5860 RepID=A0A6V7SYB9_PLAVN|nr:conserved Plasmodium protein, unknown function [Plasmodium vinckei]